MSGSLSRLTVEVFPEPFPCLWVKQPETVIDEVVRQDQRKHQDLKSAEFLNLGVNFS